MDQERIYRKEIQGQALHPESMMMSYGYDPHLSEGAIKCPIFQTSTFVFHSAEEGKSFFEVAHGLREKGPSEVLGLIYSRFNNPDMEILEDRLKLWDEADESAVFASGMAAINTAFMSLLKPGDYIFHSEPLYGGTEYLIQHILPKFGIHSIGFPSRTGGAEAEKILLESGHKDDVAMIYLETPANPTNFLVDIELCSKLAQKYSTDKRKILLAVDNTFLGPVWQQPMRFGADVVIYSATKYIGGHSDVIAGVCSGKAEPMKAIRSMRSFTGNMIGPWTGWLLLRSLETLKIRMTAQMKTARYIADFLANHPQVEKVYYPGLLSEDDPQFSIYRKQCLSPGAMISFDVVGGEKGAFKFLNSLKLAHLAVSLGGTETLVEHPAAMTHSDIPPAERVKMGISDSMIRLSVGLEHADDLIADLKQALAAM